MRLKGYTLVEILVSLTVIGLLFGFGFASFRDFSRRQAVASAGRMVIADLRLAQSKALSGEKPCTGNLSTYDFTVISTTSYQINAVCSGIVVNNVIVKTQPLPSGILISSAPSNTISFKVLGQGISGSGVTITLSQTGTTNISTVTVSVGGEIK